jgi:hypothetical protein
MPPIALELFVHPVSNDQIVEGLYYKGRAPTQVLTGPNVARMGRAHTTEENGKWGETKQRSENQVAFNSVLGPS